MDEWVEWICWYSKDDPMDGYGRYRDAQYMFSDKPDVFTITPLDEALAYLESRAYPNRKLTWFRAPIGALSHREWIVEDLT